MIELYFGGPVWQLCYDPEALSDDDRVRLDLKRAPRAEKDWQVSRSVAAALRRAVNKDRNAPVSLSHSHGHALAGLVSSRAVLGVDLERCRQRDIDALAHWICSPEERFFLDAVPDPAARMQWFYVLWTVKEALVKAAALPFPAGMQQVGLAWGDNAEVTLRAPGGDWQAMAWTLPHDWVAAAAWQVEPGSTTIEAVRWHQLEPAQWLGSWQSGS